MAIPDTILPLIVAEIVTSGAVGSNAEAGRHDAWPQTDLPCARVYLGATEIEPETLTSPRTFRHHMEVHIEVFAQRTKSGGVYTSADINLETTSATILTRLKAFRTISGNVADFYHTSTDREYTTEGKRPIARATHTFRASWLEAETA